LLDLGYVSPEDIGIITGKRGKVTPKGLAKGNLKARPAARAARVAKTSKKAAARRRSR